MSLANGNLMMMKVDDAKVFAADFVTELASTPLEVWEFVELRRTQMSAEAFEQWRSLMIQRHVSATTSESCPTFEL